MTAMKKPKYPINKYDERHDILHVFLDSQRYSSADEEFPGIYVNRNDDTDMIVGFTIMDYKHNKKNAKKLYPHYDFGVV